jgi:uncharacterized membrane protein
MPGAPPDATTEPDRLPLVVEAMKETRSRVLSLSYQAMGVYLVVFGWAASRSNPEPIVCPDASRHYVTLTVVVFVTVFITLLIALLRKQNNLRAHLRAKGETMALLAEHYAFYPATVIVASLVIVLLSYAFLRGMIYAGAC